MSHSCMQQRICRCQRHASHMPCCAKGQRGQRGRLRQYKFVLVRQLRQALRRKALAALLERLGMYDYCNNGLIW